jgi:hypothetical protein
MWILRSWRGAERMPYDKLWEIARGVDWRLMTDEYKALGVGTFVVAVVLIWNRIRNLKRMRTMESRLDKLEKEINILKVQETRRLVTELNAKSTKKTDSPESTPEIDGVLQN